MGCNCTKEGVPDEEGRDVVSMSNRSSSPDPNRPDGGVEHKTKQMKEMALENLSFEPGDAEKQPGDTKPIRAKPAVPGGVIPGKYSTSGGSGGNQAWGPLGGAVNSFLIFRQAISRPIALEVSRETKRVAVCTLVVQVNSLTKVTKKVTSAMGSVSRPTLTAASTKVNSRKTSSTAEVN